MKKQQIALFGIGEIPEVITDENYLKAVQENNLLFHALKGKLKEAHNYFIVESDNFTDIDNLYKNSTISAAWQAHLKTVNKIAKELTKTTITPYTQNYTEGKNYKQARGLSTTEIANLIKKELKAIYPDWKISVKSDYFANGSSIDVKISDVPFNPFNKEFSEYMSDDNVVWYEYRDEQRRSKTYYTEEFLKEKEKIKEIVNQYNFNDSDGQIDYFHTNYYSHVNVEDAVLMFKYFPSNKSLIKDIERNKEWESKRIEANKKAAERKGKYAKGQPVLYEYTGHQFPQGKYKAEILKSPNGRGRFTGYDLRVTIDKRKDKEGNVIALDKPQTYTFNDVSEQKIFPFTEENPLLKQQFKVGETVLFNLENPIMDLMYNKTQPVILPGTYEVKIERKTKGDYPKYYFKIPFKYFNEHHQKEFEHTRHFGVSPINMRPLNQKNNFAFAKAKALALELELQLLNLKGLGKIDEETIDKLILLYEKAQHNKTGNDVIVINQINKDSVNRILSETGINLSGYKHIITFNGARHIYNMHGKNFDKLNNQKPVESENFALLPFILNGFDTVEKGKGDTIIYTKKIGHKYYVVEEILYKSMELRIKTMYIKNR